MTASDGTLSHDVLRTYLLQTPNRRRSGNETDRVHAYKKRMSDALMHNRVVEGARVVDEMRNEFHTTFPEMLGMLYGVEVARFTFNLY